MKALKRLIPTQAPVRGDFNAVRRLFGKIFKIKEHEKQHPDGKVTKFGGSIMTDGKSASLIVRKHWPKKGEKEDDDEVRNLIH